MTRADRRFALTLLAIVAVALAVRVAFTLIVDPQPPPISDATTYHALGRNLADGKGYVRPWDLELGHRRVPTAEFPPLFPVVLAGLSLAGVTTMSGQALAMCAVGAGTVALTGLLGRRVAGPAVGLVAAGIAALHPMLFQSDAIPMPETLFACLVTAALLLALRAAALGSPRRWAATGAVVGLAALTRSEGYLLALLLVVPLAWRRWRELGAAFAALAIVVSPWIVRNAVVFGELQPGGHNSGTALAGANCDATWRGAAIGTWQLACVTAVRGARGNEADVAARYRRAGLDYVRRHLGALPKVSLVRAARTWGVYHRLRQSVYLEALEGRSFRWQLLGTRVGWAVLPLAALGPLALARCRRWWVLLAAPAMVTIVTFATYGNQRFREAAEPSLAVLAAATVVTVAARRRPVRSEP